MLVDLRSEMLSEYDSADRDRKALREMLVANDQKRKRVTDAYAEGVLEIEEYREAKENILRRKDRSQRADDRTGEKPFVLARTDLPVRKLLI